VADGAGFTREPFDKNADSLSGSPFESVVIAGVTYVLKHLGREIDWIMRAFGDGLHGTPPRVVVMWQAGLFETLPDVLDHALVGASFNRDSGRAAILMRDIGSTLVPTGTAAIDFAQHRRFLDHMAALHAAFWGWEDTIGLTPFSHRYLSFGPWLTQTETALGSMATVPRLVEKGWARFHQAAPRAAGVVLGLVSRPWALVEALEATPSSLLHGDWKAGNLGTGPDGRTILLDWALPGRGPVATELAWYLAINAARLPHPYEDAIAAYRRSLEGQGIDTEGWWERQLGLALLGALVQFGWDKALFATADDLAWWEERALEGIRYL